MSSLQVSSITHVHIKVTTKLPSLRNMNLQKTATDYSIWHLIGLYVSYTLMKYF